MNKKIRPIAFVLPQFHPIPENDKWWGKGFTEWTNVKKAQPLFKSHYQPHIPSDLGYYDLREPDARKAQADIAKEHGIYGFCYYHYWFNGKRLLNQPIDGILKQKELDMPFMFCWANENWTRRWDGKENEILIKQKYSFEDDVEHMRWLCKNIFSDERYIKIKGSPVFSIYRQDLFPNISKTIELWRKIAREEFGFKDLYLCDVQSFNSRVNPESLGFNAAVEFSPHDVLRNRIKDNSVISKIKRKLSIYNESTYSKRDFKKGVLDILNRQIKKDYKLYRTITPNWDNTARKKEKAIIGIGSTPELYEFWLKSIIKKFKPFSKDENFIFINAMNEWAEGNHLEPCIKYGKAYLEATKKALE